MEFVDLVKTSHGSVFTESDVLVLNLETGELDRVLSSTPYEVLVDRFSLGFDLLSGVATYTNAIPRFRVGTGKTEINALGTYTYVGQLNYNAFKDIDFDQQASADFDSDGLPDAFETDNDLDPFDDADALADRDSDGLSNLEEFQIGSSIDDPDSDGDGIIDGIDEFPTVASNICDGDVVIFEFHTVGAGNTETCAAGDSIDVESTIDIQVTGHLKLISPIIRLKSNFTVNQGAELSITSRDPGALFP